MILVRRRRPVLRLRVPLRRKQRGIFAIGTAFWYTAAGPQGPQVTGDAAIQVGGAFNLPFHSFFYPAFPTSIAYYNETTAIDGPGEAGAQMGCSLILTSPLAEADEFLWNWGDEDPGGGAQSMISGVQDGLGENQWLIDSTPSHATQFEFWANNVNASAIECQPTLNNDPYGPIVRVEPVIF